MSSTAQARHHIGIDIFAVAKGVLPKDALVLKAEFFVEMNSGRVVGEDAEFDTADIMPVVGGVDQG